VKSEARVVETPRTKKRIEEREDEKVLGKATLMKGIFRFSKRTALVRGEDKPKKEAPSTKKKRTLLLTNPGRVPR